MAIEIAYTMPREWPREFRGSVENQFYPQVSSLYSESPLSQQDSYYGPQVVRFICKMVLPPMRGPKWREISGFLASLRGPNKTVRLVDYHRMRCGYDVAVTPTVANWSDDSTWNDGSGWSHGFLPPFVTVDEAAVAARDSLVVRFPSDYVNLENVFRPGDLVEVRPNGSKSWFAHLYEISRTSRLGPDARTRIYFEPGLRAGVRAGDMLVLRYPASVFKLAHGQDATINRTAPGNIGTVGLTFRECLP